jgi:hypothetical protein
MKEEDFLAHLPDPATLPDKDMAEIQDHWEEFEEGYPAIAGELEKRYGHHVEAALKKRGKKLAQKGGELEAEYDRLCE